MTILSCDNVPGNGDVARAAIIAVAERHGVELVRYVEMCTLPNSMVDRITPQTRDADREWLRDEVGVDDAWPVICERFRQWVVEDRFAVGRPRWEDAGVWVPKTQFPCKSAHSQKFWHSRRLGWAD
jgi:mannitol 2-dehydrogenase